MNKLPTAALPTPATVLGLGLLGLLLWGQCAFHLNEGSGSSQPPPPNLHLTIVVATARLDSFSTRGPERAYARVTLQNRSDKPCRLGSVDCGVNFDKQSLCHNFSRTAYQTLLPAHGTSVIAMELTPFPETDSKKGTDFKRLRAAWQQGELARYRTRLSAYYSYYPVDGSAVQQQNSRIKEVPLTR